MRRRLVWGGFRSVLYCTTKCLEISQCHTQSHRTEHSRIEKIPKKNFPKKILFRPIPKIQKLSKIGNCLLIWQIQTHSGVWYVGFPTIQILWSKCRECFWYPFLNLFGYQFVLYFDLEENESWMWSRILVMVQHRGVFFFLLWKISWHLL